MSQPASFSRYGNVETKWADDLKPSAGPKARREQEIASGVEPTSALAGVLVYLGLSLGLLGDFFAVYSRGGCEGHQAAEDLACYGLRVAKTFPE